MVKSFSPKMFIGLLNFLDFLQMLQNINYHKQHFVESMEGIFFLHWPHKHFLIEDTLFRETAELEL